MTFPKSNDYLALMTAGANLALTAPQLDELFFSLAEAAARSKRTLTIHRAELIDIASLREITERAPGHVTLQFSHGDDPAAHASR